MNFLFMSNKKARTLGLFGIVIYMVRLTGIEPAHLSAQEPKSCVSASFTTGVYDYWKNLIIYYNSFFEECQVLF